MAQVRQAWLYGLAASAVLGCQNSQKQKDQQAALEIDPAALAALKNPAPAATPSPTTANGSMNYQYAFNRTKPNSNPEAKSSPTNSNIQLAGATSSTTLPPTGRVGDLGPPPAKPLPLDAKGEGPKVPALLAQSVSGTPSAPQDPIAVNPETPAAPAAISPTPPAGLSGVAAAPAAPLAVASVPPVVPNKPAMPLDNPLPPENVNFGPGWTTPLDRNAVAGPGAPELPKPLEVVSGPKPPVPAVSTGTAPLTPPSLPPMVDVMPHSTSPVERRNGLPIVPSATDPQHPITISHLPALEPNLPKK
jgi:hypothetical protein